MNFRYLLREAGLQEFDLEWIECEKISRRPVVNGRESGFELINNKLEALRNKIC